MRRMDGGREGWRRRVLNFSNSLQTEISGLISETQEVFSEIKVDIQ